MKKIFILSLLIFGGIILVSAQDRQRDMEKLEEFK